MSAMRWVLVIVRVPAEPSRHRVAIWRELRRTGAIQLAAAVWAFPARPAFEEALQRVVELAERGASGGGTASLPCGIFGASSAPAAERRLKDSEAKLDDYTERVFDALHAT